MRYKMEFGLDLMVNRILFLDEEIDEDYELELLEEASIAIDEAIENLGFTVISEERHDSNITLIDNQATYKVKQILRVGQFVKDRNNDVYVIGYRNSNVRTNPNIKEELTLVELNGMGDYSIDSNYDDDLRNIDYPELDIMEVANDFNFKNVIWVRPTD